ncbi:MAG: acyltransferase [Candidatus Latescibacterota bacterium]
MSRDVGAGVFGDITGDWDYATLPSNVMVGAGCWLERRSSFARFRSQRQPGLVLGRGVRVHTWTTFNVEAGGRVEVGDDSILVGAVFMCAEAITLGRGVVVSYHVTIADCDFHPIDAQERRRETLALAPGGDLGQRPPLVSCPVQIEDGAWIGIGAIVLKGVRIGRGARVGAGAVVTRDVPPGRTVAGNPARLVADPK